MRTLITSLAWIAALATAIPAWADSAPTAKTQKPSDRVTVGALANPDRRPADPHAPMLKRVPGGSAIASAPLPRAEKPQPFGTSGPPDASPLSVEQRAKLAAAAAAATPVVSADRGTKPAEHSTVAPSGSGVRGLEVRQKQLAPAAIGPLSAASGASRLTGALGVIPRPEWSAGLSPQKPGDVSTIGTTPTEASPRPAASAVQRTQLPPGWKAALPSKPAEVSTSTPRDPSLPPPSSTKATAPEGTEQEVRP